MKFPDSNVKLFPTQHCILSRLSIRVEGTTKLFSDIQALNISVHYNPFQLIAENVCLDESERKQNKENWRSKKQGASKTDKEEQSRKAALLHTKKPCSLCTQTMETPGGKG